MHDVIDFINIESTGNATDFGDAAMSDASDSGGFQVLLEVLSMVILHQTIDYITIAFQQVTLLTLEIYLLQEDTHLEFQIQQEDF